MKEIPLEIMITVPEVEDIRIKLNGQEYELKPVKTANQTEGKPPPTLVNYVHQLSEKLKQSGRHRTAETYRAALNSFLRFLPDNDINIYEINSQHINDYEQFLKNRGLISNTSSFYMRVLRTIYLRAVADGYTQDRHPFSRVYTGIGKTVKRAITVDDIHRIRGLPDLTAQEELARDLFLFSFFTRGMSFIDMAYLKPSNLRSDKLIYRRQKTGQQLVIKWEQQMQEIVERHPSANKDYLLPIIKRSNGHERSQYRGCQRLVNCLLKDIGQKAGITLPLTMYVARHSWASIAKQIGVPINIISEGMGHNSEKTTQIYLTSLDRKRLDNMNEKIINAVTTL